MIQQISPLLIDWYQVHKRDLPWRDIQDPYRIWVSEIILQQTRVNQGLDYYFRFIERFPNVQSLAEASEEEVLKYWQGLGYYSRARNLHKAAKIIVSQYQAIFPDTYQTIISLPGIGVYTAAAICSFAFNLPFAVVDGNVYRVLSRLFDIHTPIDSTEGVKLFKALAQELLDDRRAGTHNQAIMEFGALQCVPNNPDCAVCPLSHLCIAYANNTVSSLPVKQQKIQVKNRYFNYLLFAQGTTTWLQQRTDKDIWKKLYEFPLIESEQLLNKQDLLAHPYFKELIGHNKLAFEVISIGKSHKHVLTHQRIFAQLIHIVIKGDAKGKKWGQFVKISLDELGDYPISRLMEILIQNHLR